MEAVLEDALILIHEKKISSMKDLIPLLEKIAQQRQSAADHRRGRRRRGARDARREQAPRHAQVSRRKAPGFGDRRKAMLQDIAVLTGGQVISRTRHQARERGRSATSVAPSVSSSTRTTRRSSTAPARTTKIQGRIKEIREAIDKPTSDYDKEKLQERLAKLAGGVAVINVGAATEAEMKEKKARVEDALHATRAAVEEGIVPGGGVALVRAQKALKGLKLDEPTSRSASTSSVARSRSRSA